MIPHMRHLPFFSKLLNISGALEGCSILTLHVSAMSKPEAREKNVILLDQVV